jgi:hypothetical protein
MRGVVAGLVLVACMSFTPAARAEAVRVGDRLTIDLPWITAKQSKVETLNLGGRLSQSYSAVFWSDVYGRVLGILAVIPKPNTYFSEESQTLEGSIANWGFFKEKKITDQKTMSCAFGSCLTFRADETACSVFRRQIGSAGKARQSYSYEYTAGPRIYGFYCSYATPTLDSVEIDAVMQSVREN